MNPASEHELEKEISAALRGLPDLAAPPALLSRTMKALAQPAPGRVQTWANWPVPARATFFVFASMAVAAAVLGLRMVEPELLATASRLLAPLSSGLACFWGVVCALANAATLAVEHLSRGALLAGVVLAVGACGVCASFGTVFVRLASVRFDRN